MGVNSIMNDAGRIGFVIKGDYSNAETYDFLDLVYFNSATYVAKKLTVGNTPDNTEFWHIFADGNIDVNDVAPTFLQAETRENINSGEKLPVLFGKIKKWYTDLKAVAFSGSYNDLSDTPSIPAAVAVKGNAERSYRTGNVNLTPANIGAVPTANVLDSKESITANTASGNVAGALGTKEINANLQSQIDTLNSNLNSKDITSSATNNANVSVYSKSVVKSADVVFVYIDFEVPNSFDGTYTYYEILSGLPKPKYNRGFLGGVSIDGVFTQPMFEIRKDGKLYLQVRATAVNGKRIFATVMYIL